MGTFVIKPDEKLQSFVRQIKCDLLGDCEPEITFEQVDSEMFKATLQFRLEREVEQDDWRLDIEPSFAPDFHWTPHLAPTAEHIISQHSFRSPALIASDGSRQITLIPDLDIMLEGTPVKWYMDLDALENRLSIGMGNYKVKEHVLYVRKPGAAYPQGTVKIGFFLSITTSIEKISNPWREVLKFLWDRWGHELFKKGQPLSGTLEPYVDHTYNWAFERWKEVVWQEFELDGKRVGAPVFIVDVTQSPNYEGLPSEREGRSIWNQAWFSSLRSAQGLYRYARAKEDEALLEKARMTKELALSAPQKNGFFPSVIATEMEFVETDKGKIFRSKGWHTFFWGNSNRNPFVHGTIKLFYKNGERISIKSPDDTVRLSPYHVLDMSWTALLMLRWYDELEKDERLMEYAKRYADSLIRLQDEKGFFPGWLHIETLEPIDILKQSPETSLSATFLIKLWEMTGVRAYLDSAKKALKAVMEEIIPVGRWEDFETYWSCCPYGAAGRDGEEQIIGKKVARNNMHKQCNFSMFWTAEAMYYAYKATGEEEYLRVGQRCLDELLMTQASWQPPYMYVPVLGGFGVMNSDAEWNDSRQSLFAELIIRYGQELGMDEYRERGLAALYASFSMMYCPENPETKIQWEKAWKFFNKKDYGFMMENYGHDGETSPEGMGIGPFTIYDWGNGAASEAYLRVKDHFGADFIEER